MLRETFPNDEVTKRKNDEDITFTAVTEKHDGLIVEVWTDLAGRKTGHEMQIQQETEHDRIYTLTIPAKHTGFFTYTFRARHEKDEQWSWVGKGPEDTKQIIIDPSWTKNAVVYNAFVRFFGAEDKNGDGIIGPGEGGSFDDLKKELENLKKMGVNTLYLNPIHPIGELFRNYNPHDELPGYLQPGCPYSIRDYKQIDPELGIDKDNEDQDPSFTDAMNEFKELVDHAHQLGIRVFMDLVFNHTAHDCVFQRLHPEWFLYKEDIQSVDTPYLYPDEVKDGKPWGKAANTFCPFDHGYWWEDVAQLNWEYLLPEGENTPPANPTIKDMYTYFKSIPKYWIRNFGIDGFRCDVAYRVPPDFWRECIEESRKMAKTSHPKNGSIDGDVVFIAETYCDDIDILLKAGFTACYGDYHNKLYKPLTLKGYLDYMYNVDGQYFPDRSDWFLFSECHDWLRTPAKITGRHDFTPHDTESDDDIKVNTSRWTLTATLPGIPMIFNGFEKMEWKGVNLFGYSAIDWENEKDIRDYIAKVIKIRREHPALAYGTYSYLETEWGLDEQTQLMSYLRKDEHEQIVVAVNMDIHHKCNGTKIILEGLDIDFSKPYHVEDLLTGETYDREGKMLGIHLEPGESNILIITQ